MEYKVYIMLSMSGTLFSRFLKYMSNGSEFVHVSLTFDPNIRYLHSMGRKHALTPWNAGYVREDPQKGLFRVFNPYCEILEVTLEEEQYTALSEWLEYVSENKELWKYNFLGLLYLYFNKPHRVNPRFTCTEFVAWSLNQAGVTINPGKDISLIVPEDYYYIEGAKSIYRGRLHDLV